MSDPSDNETDETIGATPTAATLRPTSGIAFTGAAVEVRAPHYQIGRELGAGGMGSVLAAEDERLARTVALKVLRAGSLADPASRARFEQEARVLARIEHPNIVPMHEAGHTAEGHPFYTMKLVKGRTLQEILDGIRLGTSELAAAHRLNGLLGVFRKICDAVGFAHTRGIIHRDLKPANIMVGEFGEVLVMDWGLAKILGEADTPPTAETIPAASAADESGNLTLEGQVLGTPQYMSPEQSSGRLAETGAASDIYSLGGILQAIVTLRPPVSGSSLQEIRQRIESGDRDPIPLGRRNDRPHCPVGGAPESIIAVIRRAMSLTPGDRYPSVEELAGEIDSHLGGYATRAENASVFKQAQLYLNRHRFIFLAAMIGLAGITWTFALGLRYLRQEQAKLGGQIRELHQAGREKQAQVKKLAAAVKDFGSLRWQMATDHRQRFSPAAQPEGWRDVMPEIIARKSEPETEPWIFGGSLIGSPTAGPSALPLPPLPLDRPYQLRLTVRKIFNGGALALLIPSGTNTYAPFLIDAGRGDHRYFGVELKPPDPGVRAFVRIDRIDREQPHVIDLTVHPPKDGAMTVLASLDNRPLVKWTGAPTSAPPPSWNWAPEDPTRLHLAAVGGNWLVTGVGFAPLP